MSDGGFLQGAMKHLNAQQELVSYARGIFQNVGMDPNVVEDMIAGVVSYYLQPHRHYHDVRHIVYMLDRSHETKWLTNDNGILGFCILFHDVYYEIGLERRANEAISARMADRACKYCDSALIEKQTVRNAIMATSSFMETCTIFSDLEKQLCDLDLSSLAREPFDDFLAQQCDIAREQGVNDERVALLESAAFLEKMLAARGDDLFYTDYGKEHWLPKAKANIERLITEVRSDD